MKNAIFRDVTPYGSRKNRRFEGMYRLRHQGDNNRRARNIVFLHIVVRPLVTANVFPSSPILVTLIMEMIRSSETWAHTRVTRRNIPEDGILHSHRCENLKPYIALTGWAL
jgi:hypothetical protein